MAPQGQLKLGAIHIGASHRYSTSRPDDGHCVGLRNFSTKLSASPIAAYLALS